MSVVNEQQRATWNPRAQRWFPGWWHNLGPELQRMFLIISVITLFLGIYLLWYRERAQCTQRFFWPESSQPQWEILYPCTLGFDQIRLIEIRRLRLKSDSFLETPDDTPPLYTLTPAAICTESSLQAGALSPLYQVVLMPVLMLEPPLVRIIQVEVNGAVQPNFSQRLMYEAAHIRVQLPKRVSHLALTVHNTGLGPGWGTNITLSITADPSASEALFSERSIHLEGFWERLSFEIAMSLFKTLISGGIIGLIVTSLIHYYRETRAQRAKAQFIAIKESLRMGQIPNDFATQVRHLMRYRTFLPTPEWACLKKLYTAYQRWGEGSSSRSDESPLDPLEEEKQLLNSCPLEWAETLLLLWETYWPSTPGNAPNVSWESYRLLLRRLPRFQLSAEGAQRVKRLLRRAGAPQTQSPAQWPPAAGQPCARPYVHIANAQCGGPREEQSRDLAPANKATHGVSSLFPEGASLDASLPQTQAWLFGPTCALFWEHPLLMTWRREAIETPTASQTVRLVVGAPGSGRTTLALAVGRYLHGEEILGLYVDNPRHLQEVQHALARRLLTFLCVWAPDVWPLERELREALFHLWLAIWPKTKVALRLKALLEQWSGAPNITEKAAWVELKSWLEMLSIMAPLTRLSPKSWWQLAADVVPALGQQIQRLPQGWAALWIAVDRAATSRQTFDFESWQHAIAPLARHIPVTWFIFQSTGVPLPFGARLSAEELNWSKDDLRQMLAHRKQMLSLRKRWPANEQFQDMLDHANTPRALGRLWLNYEGQMTHPGPVFG